MRGWGWPVGHGLLTLQQTSRGWAPPCRALDCPPRAFQPRGQPPHLGSPHTHCGLSASHALFCPPHRPLHRYTHLLPPTAPFSRHLWAARSVLSARYTECKAGPGCVGVTDRWGWFQQPGGAGWRSPASDLPGHLLSTTKHLMFLYLQLAGAAPRETTTHPVPCTRWMLKKQWPGTSLVVQRLRLCSQYRGPGLDPAYRN